MRNALISVGLRRRGGNISVNLSLFVLLYYTNFKYKLKFNDLKKLNTNNNLLTLQIFFNLQKSPHFPFNGKVGQLSKRKRVLCGSINIFTRSLCLYGLNVQ